MKTTMEVLGVVLTLGMMLTGTVYGHDDGGIADASVDGAQMVLNMVATPTEIIIENVGTMEGNVGGLRLMSNGVDVAQLPYTKILQPNPFIYTKDLTPNYKVTVPVTGNLSVGDVVVLTNGVGIYTSAVVT